MNSGSTARLPTPTPILALMTALCLSCTSPSIDTPQGSEASETTAAPVAPQEPEQDPTEAWTQGFVERLPGLLEQRRTATQTLTALKKEARQVVAEANDPYQYRSILRRLYVKHEAPRLRFVHGAAVTEEAQATLAWLNEMHDHGINAQGKYHTRRIAEAIEALKEPSAPTTTPIAVPAASAEILTHIGAMVREQKLDLGDAAREDTDARVVASLLGEGSWWPALKAVVDKTKPPLSKEQVKRLVEVESFLVDSVAQYAWDMRYANRYWFKDEFHARIKRKERRRRLRNKLRSVVEERVREPGDLVAWMKTLTPQHPQYTKLIKALSQYRKMAQDGGWPSARRVIGLRKGLEHIHVRRLKAQLVAEGFHPVMEEYTDVYDDAAIAAVTAYQETHQLDVTGEPHKVFWRSLAVPLEERIEHIEITLQRWRESSIIEPLGYYVFVNIADFHLEVWKGGERLLRFKTIVGNTQWGCNINNKRWIRINQTPIQSSAINQIVVNPWWAVPERIRTQEILPAVARNPSYWDFHNFHCIKKEDGVCVDVRQGAGKRNALGKLKFLFPSPYSTFLHDTPKKHFFDRSIRALSHGCVRLHKPVELAQLLLKEDGSWDAARWERYFGAKHQHPYDLKTPVPIHVEYYTVRIDSADRVHFLADIYDHDRYRRRGQRFDPRRCSSAELENAVNPYVDDGSD